MYFLSGLVHLGTKGGKAFAVTKEGVKLPLELWTAEMIQAWKALPNRFPTSLWKTYPEDLRDQNSASLRSFAWDFRKAALAVPNSGPERTAQLKALAAKTKEQIEKHIAIDRQSPVIAQSTALFMNQAVSFDAGISGADVYQALRNVVTALFLQDSQGVKVGLTDSITAYSLLYPYTDNYIDQVLKKTSDKISFAERFRLRLEGKNPHAINQHEEKIFALVELVEREYPRANYPEVYKALLLIHDRQVQSLSRQSQKDISKWSVSEILDLSIQKGGASVLADAFLVNPAASEKNLKFAYQLGFVLQLIDDLQDAAQDFVNGDVTLFTHAIYHRESFEPLVLKLMQAVEELKIENQLFAECCYYLIAEGLMNLRQLPAYYPGMGSREFEERAKYLDQAMPFVLKASFTKELSTRFKVHVLRSADERIEKLFAEQFDKDPRTFAAQLQEVLSL
ncbi:class 1 isoprenoid biosynthesis enzyme [Bdellovibrio sp. HCB337]|uniref:class 1 isoprenoid biosynthesis enzyme n=1 Tax=Bdellovibrio sp. HCB337 TaxID=3394358 RepID=UPI0039A70AD2